jgi:hypothetical protein
MQNNPLWTKGSLPWFLILLLAGGSALFAHSFTGDILSGVLSYINFGLIILFWGSMIVPIISDIIHVLLQKLYGCELIYINFCGVLLIKEDGRWKRRKPKTLEFAEFTFMVPSDKCPLKLDFCGSVYVNIIMTAICIALAVLLPKSFWTTGVFAILAVSQLFILVMIPTLPLNPFSFIKQTKGDKKAEKALRSTCKILGALFTGKEAHEMPDEWFELPTEEELAAKPLVYGDIVACNYSRLMDEGRFKEARQLAELVYKYRCTPETHAEIKNPVRGDYLFCVIMDDCNPEVIAAVCGDDLIEYLKSKSGFLVHTRILYAYELLVNKNTTEAAERFAEFEKLVNICPVRTIAEGERRIAEYIREKLL